MRKPLIAISAAALVASVATTSFADSSSGQGEGKGRTGVANSVSGNPGSASVAGGLRGGWGGAGGVNNDSARDVTGKGDTPSGSGNNRGRPGGGD